MSYPPPPPPPPPPSPPKRRISGLSASKELPSSTEEALLLWLNKTSEAVCKQHHYLVQQLLSETNPSKRRQNRLKLMSEPGPVAIPRSSDLTTAVAHGQCLPAVVLHYFPSSFNWSGELNTQHVVIRCSGFILIVELRN